MCRADDEMVLSSYGVIEMWEAKQCVAIVRAVASRMEWE